MGTITIVEGSACGHSRVLSNRARVRLPACVGRLMPHQLIRFAVPVIRRVVEDRAFMAVVTPWRPALSIVFGGIRSMLSEAERHLARSLSSRLSSHLSHNIPMHELLWNEYARFLQAAHAVIPLEIVVEDLRQLDTCSFAILWQLLRSDAADTPDIVIGYTTDIAERPSMDERGIVWDIGLVELQQSLHVLRRLPHRAERSRSTEPCRCSVECDAWDQAPNLAAEQLLARATGELSPVELASFAPAICDVFSMFAFDTALCLSLAVLDAELPIAVADRSTLCGVAALSAHNRQFLSRSNRKLAKFLLDTYREALLHEADSELRLSLYYRLAVTCGRRLGDLVGARQAIDAGLAELSRSELPVLNRQLQEAWLRNIDAMVQLRGGDVAVAFTCCERAYAALADVTAPNRVAAAEVALSKLVIGENALTLASMMGDEPRRDLWLARMRGGFETWPSLNVVGAIEQQRAHIARLEPARARALGVIALELVRPMLNPLFEHFILVGLSDLSFRLSDYHAAAEYGEAARALAEEFGDVNRTLLALELRAAEIAEALGRLDDAAHALRATLAARASSADLQSEVCGRLAQICARQGQRDQALDLIAQSIDLAAESGELDLLLRASCQAGKVADLLGMRDDARTAYASCFELLEAAPASTPEREILRLTAVVGQKRTGAPNPAQLAMCISKLPRLMIHERDAWPLARELIEPPLARPLPAELEAALHVVATALAACAEPS